MPDSKALLKEQEIIYSSGNKEGAEDVQSQLRKRIREREECYREKMEVQLQQNNHNGVWRGLKTISDHKETKTLADGDKRWENDLNLFSSWFDQVPAPSPTQSSLLQLPLPLPAVDFSTPPPTTSPLPPPSRALFFPSPSSVNHGYSLSEEYKSKKSNRS